MPIDKNQIHQKRFSFWWQWTLANLKGFIFGTFLSIILVKIVPHETIAALPFGLSIGYHQWKVIQPYFQNSKLWIIYSSLGLITGLTVLNFIQFLTVGAFAFIPITVICFMILGLILGFYQRIILKQYWSDTRGWLMANTVGWSLGAFLTLTLDIQIFELVKMPLDYLIIGGIVGGRTGLTLVIFMKKHAPSADYRAISHARNVLTVLISIGFVVILNLFMTGPSKKYFSHQMSQAICNNLPPMQCSGGEDYCKAVIPFQPKFSPNVIDYPHVDETWENQYRSFLRRDLMMLIQYAAGRTECESSGGQTSSSKPLMLMDMSEQDGSIPGTSHGQPGHPRGSHQKAGENSFSL